MATFQGNRLVLSERGFFLFTTRNDFLAELAIGDGAGAVFLLMSLGGLMAEW